METIRQLMVKQNILKSLWVNLGDNNIFIKNAMLLEVENQKCQT